MFFHVHVCACPFPCPFPECKFGAIPSPRHTRAPVHRTRWPCLRRLRQRRLSESGNLPNFSFSFQTRKLESTGVWSLEWWVVGCGLWAVLSDKMYKGYSSTLITQIADVVVGTRQPSLHPEPPEGRQQSRAANVAYCSQWQSVSSVTASVCFPFCFVSFCHRILNSWASFLSCHCIHSFIHSFVLLLLVTLSSLHTQLQLQHQQYIHILHLHPHLFTQ